MAPERSLFRDVLDWMLLPLVMLWPLSFVVGYYIAIGIADKVFDRELVHKARTAAELIVADPSSGKVHVSGGLAIVLTDEEAADHWYRIDDAHAFLFGSESVPRPDIDLSAAALAHATFRNGVVDGKRVRIVTVMVTPKPLGQRIAFTLSASLAPNEALAREMLFALLPLQLVGIPLAALLAWLGLRYGLKPLHRLSGEIRKRRPDDLTPLDPAAAPLEMKPLVMGFNELLQRAAAEQARQKSFIDSAAHQLRTPIAGLVLTTQLAHRAATLAEKQDALTTIAAAAERSARLIEQLLALARAGHPDPQRLQVLDLARLARDVAAHHLPQADRKRIDLGFAGDVDAPATVRGDEDLLHEMIANLVENAIRYTPAGGAVTVEVRHDANDVTVAVIDTGPGIPAEDRRRVFDAFVRGGRHAEPGTGLGLAIAREIVEAHHGQIVLTEGEAGVGTRAIVTLPRAASTVRSA